MTFHTYARLMVVATLLLIVAGGLVTSTESGLAVPDWPLSYGMLFPPMIGGILYEHGHRMVAGTVALLTVILAVWLKRREPRRWVRRLGGLALLSVVLQALLGGLTVLLLLPTAVSVMHACLAQTFFCLTIAIAVVTSAWWKAERTGLADRGSPSLRILTIVTAAAVYVQLIIGALVRHMGAGLAIPDFPLAYGGLIPPLDAQTVAIHFAHRVWALVVAGLVGWTVARTLRHHRERRALRLPAVWLGALVLLQVALGGATVLSRKAVPIATAHVAVGAMILGTALLLVFRTWRLHAAAEAPAPAREPSRVGDVATGATA